MFIDVWIKKHEGKRNQAYQDSRGVWTCGYGQTGPEIGPGTYWTDEECEARYVQARNLAISQAQNDVGPVFTELLDQGAPRAAVIVDMAFQLGGAGLAGFHTMISCVQVRAWVSAAQAMVNSHLLGQTPRRCLENAATMIENRFLALG